MRATGQGQKSDRHSRRVSVHGGRITGGPQQKTTHTHAAPPDGYASVRRVIQSAITPPIRHPTAPAAKGSPDKTPDLCRRQTVFANEVSGQPRDEELKAEPRSEIAAKQRDHRGIEQQGLPRHAFPGLRRRRRARLNQPQFLGVDRPVIGRIFAIPEHAHGAPDQSRQAEKRKRIAPPDESDDGNRDRRSQRAADLAPIHMMPLARLRSCEREPPGQRAESVGKAPASAAPNTVRVISSIARLRAIPVKIVNRDQQPTIRISIRRWPQRSPSHAVGISKMPYAM